MAKVKRVLVSLLCFVLVFSLTGFDFSALKASAGMYMVFKWSALKDEVKNASSGTTIYLGKDITTDELDNRIVANKKTNLTIDLYGHSIKKENGSKCYKDGHILEVMGNSTVTLTDSIGGGSLEYGCGNNGGAINIHDGSTVTISNVTFQNNRAGIDGGAIFNRGTLKMNNCVIKNNTAKDTGGGIYNSVDGKFELNNVEICYNKCDNDGGGLNIHTDGTSVMKNCNIHHNTSKDEGAGFRFDDNGETLKLYNTSITDNVSKDDGGGFYLEDGTVRLYGCDISRNKAEYGGGFCSEEKVVLEADDKYGMNVISSNTATDYGGGIFSDGEVIIDSADINNNVAYIHGGGLFIRSGKCRFNNGIIQKNIAVKYDGGGMCVADAEIWIRRGEVSKNMAGNDGGGIYCDSEMDKLHVSSTPVIKNNDAARAKDLFLYCVDKIDLDGKLESGAYISFSFFYAYEWEDYYTHDVEFDRDVTTDYSDYNGKDDPNLYFHCAENYKLKLSGGEVQVVDKKVEPERPAYPEPVNKNTFIPWNEQIDCDTEISGHNWLAGISGERKLNEINTPVSHDASMKEISGATKCIGSFTNSYDYAVTQYNYIYELLDIGIRRLDLRVANKRVWKKGRSRGDQKDDGKNLYMCHGEDSAGGTYYAEDPVTGYPLNFLTVLDWIEDFLACNPTEYVMVTFKAECQHDYDRPKTYKRLKKILKEHINDINPTTGEPYFYMQDGVFEKHYTDWPQLKDVRGKIVIACEGNEDEYGISYGGLEDYSFNGRYYEPKQEGSYKDSETTRLKRFKAFAKKEIATRNLPTDASRIIDSKTGKEVFVEGATNCVDAGAFSIPGIEPLKAAEHIHPEIYGPGKVYGPENKGKYLGWISGDGATALTCKYVYDTNYFDGLQYVTVNVLSNKEGIPNQSFKLLKGSKITIPGYIYDYQQSEANGYFTGWSIGKGACLEEGSIYTVNEDVTFKANWATESGFELTKAKVVWQDADNKDGLRPDELAFTINGNTDYTVAGSNEWSRPIPDYVNSIAVNWDKASANIDGEGTYKCEVSGNNLKGWVITLTHTPSDKIDIPSKVSFFDGGSTFRPATVTFGLYENGSDDLIAQKEFAIGESVKAEETFTSIPKYKDGKEVNYEIRYISCTNNSENTTDLEKYNCIISGYDVEYWFYLMKDVDLSIFWVNVAEADRPEQVDAVFRNKDTGVVYSSRNYINQDENDSDVCTFTLPIDSVSEGTEDGTVDFDKYDVEVNTVAEGIFFNVFKNDEGYYIVATGTEYESDVAMVEALIDDIGEITNDNVKESRVKVETAEYFYGLLSESDKELVSNYDTLTSARKTFDNLTFARAVGVIFKISMLQPKFITYNETVRAIITSARNSYDGLDDIEKENVPNYNLLVDAERIYEQLEKEALKNQEAAQKVIDLIDDIGEVVYSPDDLDNDSFADIDSARSAYDDLPEEAKELVTNYDVLLSAEEEYERLRRQANPENGISLTLGKDITSNYYVDYAAYVNADKIVYTYNSVNESEQNVPVTETVDLANIPAAMLEGDRVKLTVSQAPAQMAEPTVIEILDGNNQVIDTLNYSAKTYCDNILSMSDDELAQYTDKGAELRTLCHTMIAYGQAAQGVFADYETVPVVCENEAVNAQIEAATATANHTVDNSGMIKFSGVSFVCTKDARLRFYLNTSEATSTPAAPTASTGNAALKYTLNGAEKQYFVEVSGINAADFNEQITVNYGGSTISLSVLDFAGIVLRDGSGASTALQHFAKTLVVYNTNALAFFN